MRIPGERSAIRESLRRTSCCTGLVMEVHLRSSCCWHEVVAIGQSPRRESAHQATILRHVLPALLHYTRPAHHPPLRKPTAAAFRPWICRIARSAAAAWLDQRRLSATTEVSIRADLYRESQRA